MVIDDVDENGKIKQTLYFVTETKGNTNLESLRISEKRKILCAKKHFGSINVDYKIVDTPESIFRN